MAGDLPDIAQQIILPDLAGDTEGFDHAEKSRCSVDIIVQLARQVYTIPKAVCKLFRVQNQSLLKLCKYTAKTYFAL